jgi:alpha-beta hydrolase superfamily lysophospholipase
MPSTDTTVRDVLIPTADGLDLHARYWAIPDPRGVVVVAHGFGEHGNWYDHVARAVGPAAGVDFADTAAARAVAVSSSTTTS